MQYFRVKNLDKFQHYKERNPPWIKLHRSIFEDYQFECLQDASKLHLILIWVLASQCDNKLPLDSDWLKRKLGVKNKVDVQALIDQGFLVAVQDASNTLAGCQQSADSEERQRRDREEAETYIACEKSFEICWAKYPRKAGNKTKAFTEFQKSVWGKDKNKVDEFITKMDAYVASVKDPEFLKHGETFFRNWQDLAIDNNPKKPKMNPQLVGY